MTKRIKYLALTFDDGPAETTQAIVEALRLNQARATFFVNGSCLKKYPHITKMAFDSNCEIGNHTTDHLHLPELSYEEVIREIETTKELIKEIIGEYPRLMRPPFGEYNEMTCRAAKDCGLPLINWSIDPCDWDSDDAQTTRKRILENLHDNAIILCHDRMKSTSELMMTFVKELKVKGYELVTVSELFRINNEIPEAGRVYLQPTK